MDEHRSATIAPNQKYALLALDAQARLDGDWLEIAPDLIALHDPPVDLPKHWREWLGTIEAQRVEKCRLFILACMSTSNPGVLDEENRWLEHRADLFYRAIALASVGFQMRYGMIMIGARGQREPDVRQAAPLRPIVNTPGLPVSFVVTPAQLKQAERLARVLWDLGEHAEYRRLWRALRAFDAALHTQDLSMRLHQLIRAIEGVVPIPQGGRKATRGLSQREWFAAKVSLMCGGAADQERLLAMYDSRGATEHLALPVRDVQARDPSLSAAEAEVPFAQLVFAGEGLARHALIRVLSTPSLRKRFISESGMIEFWGQNDAVVQREWGESFALAEYAKRFDGDRARDDFERGRAERQRQRAIIAKAPDTFRSGEQF